LFFFQAFVILTHMNQYEMTVIISPKLSEKDAKAKQANVEKWIEAEKGKLKKTDVWGRLKLAYPIKKETEALYIQYFFEVDPKGIKNIENKLKLEEQIMRYLIIKNQ